MKILLLLAFILLNTVATAAPAPVKKLSNFDLTDQNSKLHSFHFPKKRVSLITVADHKGSSQVAPWIQVLHKRYAKRVNIDGVADVSMIPKLFQNRFREGFRKKFTYPIMLDWEGRVVKEFAYTKGMANIYLVDRNGRILYQVTGPMQNAGAQKFFSAIDRAIKK